MQMQMEKRYEVLSELAIHPGHDEQLSSNYTITEYADDAHIHWICVTFLGCWNHDEYGDAPRFVRWAYTFAMGTALGNLRLPFLDALLILILMEHISGHRIRLSQCD